MRSLAKCASLNGCRSSLGSVHATLGHIHLRLIICNAAESYYMLQKILRESTSRISTSTDNLSRVWFMTLRLQRKLCIACLVRRNTQMGASIIHSTEVLPFKYGSVLTYTYWFACFGKCTNNLTLYIAIPEMFFNWDSTLLCLGHRVEYLFFQFAQKQNFEADLNKCTLFQIL